MAKTGGQFHFASVPNIQKGGATVSINDLEPISIKNMQRDQSLVHNSPEDSKTPSSSPRIEELPSTFDVSQANATNAKVESLIQNKSEQKHSHSDNLNQKRDLPGEMSSKNQIPKSRTSTTSDNRNSLNQDFIGRKVLPIDPKLASNRLREFPVQGLVSPSHPRSPSPALGSILQTPSDKTPTRVSGHNASSTPQNIIGSSIPRQTYPPAIIPDQHIRNKPQAPSTSIQQPNWQELSQNNQFTSGAKVIDNLMSHLPALQNQNTSTNQVNVSKEESGETQKLKIQDAKIRADYRVKFSILREAYPKMEIPEPSTNQSVDEIDAMYREYAKRIHVDSSVEQNKVFLLILWLLIEIVGCRMLRLPFSGYTLNQFKYMNKYQMLLIELGDKSHESSMVDGWPVEIRIGAMALFNGVIFILVKLLSDKVGLDMAEQLRELIGNFLTQNRGSDVLKRAEQATSDNPPPPQVSQDVSPPLGGIGNLIAQFASAFAGMNGGSTANTQQQDHPQFRRPTTFASRRRKQPNN